MEEEEGLEVGAGQPHLVCPLPRNLLLQHLQLGANYEQILPTSWSKKTKPNKQKTAQLALGVVHSTKLWKTLLIDVHSTYTTLDGLGSIPSTSALFRLRPPVQLLHGAARRRKPGSS